MPVKVKCPACKAPHPKPVEYRAQVTCEMCGETFAAPPPPPAPLPPEAFPPKPVPVADPNADFDFEPKTPKYKGESESSDPDQPPDRPATRPGRKRYGNRRRKWLTCGMIGTTLFALVIFGCCGIAFYNDFLRPKLAPFEESPNPYKPGTQVNLREVRTVKLPALAVNDQAQLAHSPKHNFLFFRTLAGVWVYDLKELEPTGTFQKIARTGEMDLTPNQSVLYVGDMGAARIHRFNLASRTWTAFDAPSRVRRVQALDETRLLAVDATTWPQVRMCREGNTSRIVDVTSFNSTSESETAYHPRNGSVAHAANGQLSIRVTNGRTLRESGQKLVIREGGGALHFSPDGLLLYHGPRQYDATDLNAPPRKFPEVIVAASRDVAFGQKAYYRADDATQIAEYEFKTVPWAGNMVDGPRSGITVSPDGLSVWMLDPAAKLIRQYALEGDE